MAVAAQAFSSEADYCSSAADQQVVISVPSGTQDGDLLLAIFSRASGRAISCSGWTGLVSGDYIQVLYRVASSEPANYTFDVSATSGYAHGVVMRVTGQGTTKDAGSENFSATWAGTLTCPNLTITDASSLVVWIGTKISESTTATVASSTRGTEWYDNDGGAYGLNLHIYVETGVGIGTASGAVFTMTSEGSNYAGNAIAIGPAAAPPSFAGRNQPIGFGFF